MVRRLFPVLLIMIVAIQPAAAREPRPKATLADFGWLTGHWTGPALGGLSEEVWSDANGGSMMGMYRLVKDGRIVFYELLTLVEEGDSVVLRLKHFNADLTGWEEKAEVREFPLVSLTPTEAAFDGMTFDHSQANRLAVRLLIGDKKTGKVREEHFAYTRVPSRD